MSFWKRQEKLHNFTRDLTTLEAKLKVLERDHVNLKERLRGILQPLVFVKDYGSEWLSILKPLSEMGWVALGDEEAYGGCTRSPTPLFSALYDNEDPRPWNSTDRLEEAGLVLLDINSRLEDMARNQDHVKDLILRALDFLNEKALELVETTSVSSQYESDDLSEVLAEMWNETIDQLLHPILSLKACNGCSEEFDDKDTSVGTKKKRVPKEIYLLESIALELQATYDMLLLQMNKCDDLLLKCTGFHKKQEKFQKAWSVPLARAPLVLDNSEETEGGVDVLVFLEENSLVAEACA